jgi:hypothetical protein
VSAAGYPSVQIPFAIHVLVMYSYQRLRVFLLGFMWVEWDG